MSKKYVALGSFFAIAGIVCIGMFFVLNKKTYEVLFDSQGGSAVSKQTVKENETVTRPTDPTRDGYEFNYWAYNNQEYNFSTKVTKNMTLVAVWKDNLTYYTVTFNSDGGEEIGPVQVRENDKVSEPTIVPTKTDYVFKEWQLDGMAYDFSTPVVKDIELKAVYDKADSIRYTVKFDTDGGNTIKNQNIKYNGKVTKPTNPTKKGYKFVEWQLNGLAYDFTQIVKSDMTLTAIWEKAESYTVTFNSKGGSTVKSQTVLENGKVTKPANPKRNGYVFVEWQLDGKAYDFTKVVTKDITLTAKWDQSYVVSFDTDGGNKIDNQNVKPGSKVNKPTNPKKTGYVFVEWQLDGKTYDFNSEVTKNITLKAKWDVQIFTVSFDSDGGSDVKTQNINYGTKVTKPANPTRNGYEFVEWQLNGKAYDFNSTVTSNIILKAKWRQVTKEDVYAVLVTIDSDDETSCKLVVTRNGSSISFSSIETTDGVKLADADGVCSYDKIKDLSKVKVIISGASHEASVTLSK